MAEPVLVVRQASASRAAPGHWRISWDVANAGAAPVELSGVWLPHGRFRGEEETIDPAVAIHAGESARLDTAARFQEEPGSVVENGFLILRAESGGECWQVFVRLRITAGAGGEPNAEAELITRQREGSLAG